MCPVKNRKNPTTLKLSFNDNVNPAAKNSAVVVHLSHDADIAI
jgi:hypothetical protein